MNRDRYIQLGVLLMAAVLLLGSAALIPSITDQRRDLQLSYDPVVGGSVPPGIALMTTAAGSFRGILVDALWYRVEMQKRDGQFHEANTLSEAIVSLQPRFPQVWSFIAWNQAYNISVGTYTADERWDWVSKGERMLRTRGIPYNPNAVILYKELAWIWFHKIGGGTDDFNNYYKLRVAQEWEELLGPPPPGVDRQIVLSWFRPLRDAADRYFVFGRPSHEMVALLDTLEAQAPDVAEAITPMRDMDVIRLGVALDRLPTRRGWSPSEPALATIEQLRALTADARLRSESDPLTLLYRDKPEAQPLIEAMQANGLGVDDASIMQTVRRLGRMATLAQVMPPDQLYAWGQQNLATEDMAMLGLMLDPQRDPQWRAALPFLRARALVRGMHMDPGKMYDFMALYGPLDWRHPVSHSLYWSRLGTERSGILLDRTKVDILNTYRGIVHALQTLSHEGRVNYDPLADRVTYQPDPRFIDSYLDAVVEGKSWVTDTEGRVNWSHGVLTSFEAGHENFLQVAVVYEYLYGREAKARERFQVLRDTYGDRPHNVASGLYKLDLELFITAQYLENGDMKDMRRGFIDGLLYRSFQEGLALQRGDVFARYITIAKASHEQYNKLRSNPASVAYAESERLALPAFEQQLVPDAFARYLSEPGIPLDMRSVAYRFAPPGLQRLTYPRFSGNVSRQVRESIAQAGRQSVDVDAQVIMDQWFPRPAGVEPTPDASTQPPVVPGPGGAVIERQ